MTTKKQLEQTKLVQDAQNRAWRAFVQGLGIDLLTAVAIVVAQVVAQPLEAWQGWLAVGVSLARSVAGAAASYVMRRFLDRSKIPTPLPPGDRDAD
jgi:hypothetical protein